MDKEFVALKSNWLGCFNNFFSSVNFKTTRKFIWVIIAQVLKKIIGSSCLVPYNEPSLVKFQLKKNTAAGYTYQWTIA